MKRVFGFIMIFSVLILTGTAFAQERVDTKEKLTVEQRADKKANHMKEKLKLDDGQKEAVYQLILEQEREKEAERMNRKAKAERVDAALQDILSAEQLAEYKAMKAKRKMAVKKRHKMMKEKARGSCCSKAH